MYGDVVMLTAPPTTIGILLFDEPKAGAHCCRETFRPIKPQTPCQRPVHNLAGIEDDGLAAGFAIMSGKGAIRVLEGEFPVDHAMGAVNEVRAFKSFGGVDKGFDDIACGFGISRQPTILEAPAG